MKIKTVICNCKGLSPSLRNSDMNTLPFEIELDLDVDYAIVHPQLCGAGGSKVMEDVLRSRPRYPRHCRRTRAGSATKAIPEIVPQDRFRLRSFRGDGYSRCDE